MIIHIKNLKDRKTFDVDVTPNSTADDVKFAVEKQCGVAPSSQRLVFGGRPLKDGATLAELGAGMDVGLLEDWAGDAWAAAGPSIGVFQQGSCVIR